MKSIHPFPARMAPEIAFNSLRTLPKKACILDPMSGSGTVLRQAVLNGYSAIGYDMDPLAVMMSKAYTADVNFDLLDEMYKKLISLARNTDEKKIKLPWIDSDKETSAFVKFWFAAPQKKVLRRLAYGFIASRKIKDNADEAVILKIAFSKLIVAKKRGASLAWDVSHSRPHKVAEVNDFDVWKEFDNSYNKIKSILIEEKITGKSRIHLGDARKMSEVSSKSVDAVITSPPYLNAIDYLRGHKLSLVWLGYKVSEIRNIRAECIGTERYPASSINKKVAGIIDRLAIREKLPTRHMKMIERYTQDACLLMKEISRVLKPKGKAILVVGDSCLKEVFVKNSSIFCEAAKLNGLKLNKRSVRELPIGSRYLPLPKDGSGALSKRMKAEVVMEFASR